MLRYSVLSSQTRLLSASRQRTATQLLANPIASNRITAGQVPGPPPH